MAVVAIAAFTAASLYKGLKVVPQSERWTVERFGKYTRTLNAGLNVIVPWVDKVSHRVSVLERQTENQRISVITSDNVEVVAEATVFYRVEDPSKAMYRIEDAEHGIGTMSTSVVRSAGGKLDLDAIQSSRETMNQQIAKDMEAAAEEWGIQITRTEITDIVVDDETREAQRRQILAARERRAMVELAEGEREAMQRKADGELYAAEKAAEAIRRTAEAEAYAVEKMAKAHADQTRMVGKAIRGEGGGEAITYEIKRQQVKAIEGIGQGEGSRVLMLPTEVVGVLGAVEVAAQALGGGQADARRAAGPKGAGVAEPAAPGAS